jgi:hypothetical protein
MQRGGKDANEGDDAREFHGGVVSCELVLLEVVKLKSVF